MKLIKPQLKGYYAIFLMFIFFLYMPIGYSQTSNSTDLLKNKTYKELAEGFYKYEDLKPALAKLYAKTYLCKGKNEKDTTRIANAYSQIVSLSAKQNIVISIKYADSIIQLTNYLKNKTYPSFGYLIKGICLNNQGKYKLALENYLIAQKHAEIQNNYEQLFSIRNAIGHLKYFWGDINESKEIFRNQLKLLNENPYNFKDYDFLQINTLYNLSNSYILSKEYDSASYYSNIGVTKKQKVLKNDKNTNFLTQGAEIDYYNGNYRNALDSLNIISLSNESINNIFDHHVLKGKIYKKQQLIENSFFHFSKADSIYNITNEIVPDLHLVHEFFVHYYRKRDDLKNQLKYINKLVKTDSIINHHRRELSETIYQQYDLPILIKEKQEIINELNKDDSSTRFLIGLFTIISLLAILFFYSIYKKQHSHKKHVKTLENYHEIFENQIEIPEIKTPDLNGISEEIITDILLKLKKFEKQQSFTKNAVSLKSLSELFETNPNYLSRIINAKKGQNFSSYLSDLRIHYAVNRLQTDVKYREYSIKLIAFKAGFNNPESFSRAFYKKTGKYPSIFIKEITSF